MIIKDVQLSHTKTSTSLTARCKIRKIGWDTVYFKVASKNRTDILNDASPFAAAMLIPAMKQGEDLIIKGSISKQLYDGMQIIIDEVLGWDIGLKPIKIVADKLTEDNYRPTKVGTFFSGGVDSFYTYLKHTKDNNNNTKVDSLIFVNNGNDIDPRNKRLWKLATHNLENIADDGQVDLIVVESNINSLELLNPIISWDYIHGGCLAAVGLFLRRGFNRIYIPSTHSKEQQTNHGSNLALDNNWSTEKTTFIHDGTESTRLNKVTSLLAKSPIALKYLRVCYMNTKGTYNCGQCDKCLRTMINLYIAGALQQAQTFPHQLDLKRIAETPTIMGEGMQIFHNENLSALKQKHLNPGLQKALETSINLTQQLHPKFSHKLKDKAAYFDHLYLKGYVQVVYHELFGKRFA